MWYHKKKKFLEGIQMCLELNDEQFSEIIFDVQKINKDDMTALNHIKIENEKISSDGKILILKTVLYLVHRLNIFIMSPLKLGEELNQLGFTPEKSQILVKFYSEMTKRMVKDIDSYPSTASGEEVLWNMTTTLSDPMYQKCKLPRANITLKMQSQQINFDNLSHSELSKLFDKLETIQTEIDNLNKK